GPGDPDRRRPVTEVVRPEPEDPRVVDRHGPGGAVPQAGVVECREGPVVKELLDPQPPVSGGDLEPVGRRVVAAPGGPARLDAVDPAGRRLPPDGPRLEQPSD